MVADRCHGERHRGAGVTGREGEGVGIERERQYSAVIRPGPHHAALQDLHNQVGHGIRHRHGEAELPGAGNDQENEADERRSGETAEVGGKAKGSIKPARSLPVTERQEPAPVQRVHSIYQLLQMSPRIIVTEMTRRGVTYSLLPRHDRATI